jgi:lysophospholipase L1-like esterase
MVTLARAENPDVCVVLWGTPWARSNPQRSANIARYNDLLQELARELDVLYCDTWPVLQQLSEDDAYIDEVHLSGQGARLIAQRIHETLRASGRLQILP